MFFLENELPSHSHSLTYRVLHPLPVFAESISTLPAHLLQHLSTFIHLADLPLGAKRRHETKLMDGLPRTCSGKKKKMPARACVHINGGRGVVPLEGAVAAHRLPAGLGPVLVPRVLQGLGLLVLAALVCRRAPRPQT